MRRYWVDLDNPNGDEVQITGPQFHHICEVCRQGLGSRFEVLAPGGQALFVEIFEMGKKQARARVLERRQIKPLPKPHIHLAVSLPKFSTFELIVEKSVELGVFQIHPFFSENSFVRSLEKISSSKVERWNKIVLGATQQSGRGDLMQIQPPIPLKKLLEDFNRRTKVVGLIPYEGEGGESLSDQLNVLKQGEFEDIFIFVGSEGGFSQPEVELFKRHGMAPCTLGEQILRVETACLALVSIIKYDLNLLT